MSHPRAFSPSAAAAPVSFGPSGSAASHSDTPIDSPVRAGTHQDSAPSSHDDWRSVRSQFSDLGQRPMTVAETGARLFALLCAVPSLLTHVARQTFDTAAREDGKF